MRTLAILSLVALTVGVPGSRAASGPGQVAFSGSTRAGRGADIVLFDALGDELANLTADETGPFPFQRQFSWSPDGTRVAFFSTRDGTSAGEIYVMNADGTNARRLTFDSRPNSTFNLRPAWSPDGGRIAWVKDAAGRDSLWRMWPDGTHQQQIVAADTTLSTPKWSPDGTRLLYTTTTGSQLVFVVAVGGGPAVQVGQPFELGASWSPDGRRIALAGVNGVVTVDPDGGSRRVVAARGLYYAAPSWSPDGTELAFTGIRVFPEYGSRYGAPQLDDVFVVKADGTDERRLTGRADEEYFYSPTAVEPTWWPDGSRLFFVREGGGTLGQTTWVMNRDGTCEGPFSRAGGLQAPQWRPGTGTALPRRCVDLRIWPMYAGDGIVGIGQDAVLTIGVDNDGTEIARNVRLVFSSDPDAHIDAGPSCVGDGSVTCPLRDLAPGKRVDTLVFIRSRTPGPVRTTVHVASDGEESDPLDDERNIPTTVLPCTFVGTGGNDVIVGTAGRDRICGRTGADRIRALAGRDLVDAGNGDDTIEAGPGRDVVYARGGNDVILVRDGERDVVDCGSERDVVVADRVDVIRNCRAYDRVLLPPPGRGAR